MRLFLRAAVMMIVLALVSMGVIAQTPQAPPPSPGTIDEAIPPGANQSRPRWSSHTVVMPTR